MSECTFLTNSARCSSPGINVPGIGPCARSTEAGVLKAAKVGQSSVAPSGASELSCEDDGVGDDEEVESE